MHMQPCRCDLYAYEMRILFLLLKKDRVDVAREIGRALRESNVAVQSVFTTPASHRIGSAFLHSLMPDGVEASDKIMDIDIKSDQVVSELEKRVGARSSQEFQELLKLIPSFGLSSELQYQRRRCQTVAVAPEIPIEEPPSAKAAKPGPRVVECIIDQRTGQAHMQWLM